MMGSKEFLKEFSNISNTGNLMKTLILDHILGS